MKIEIEKKLLNGEIIKTEEFYFKIPKAIFDELNFRIDGSEIKNFVRLVIFLSVFLHF